MLPSLWYPTSSSWYPTPFALPSSWLYRLAEIVSSRLFTVYLLDHLVKEKVLKVSIFILQSLPVLSKTKKLVDSPFIDTLALMLMVCPLN